MSAKGNFSQASMVDRDSIIYATAAMFLVTGTADSPALKSGRCTGGRALRYERNECSFTCKYNQEKEEESNSVNAEGRC